jgi:hypothetical protein
MSIGANNIVDGGTDDLSRAVGRVLALGCFLVLIVAAVLIASSVIEHGKGILGISEQFSLIVLAPLIVALLLLAARVIWMGTGGEIASRQSLRTTARKVPQKAEISSNEWFKVLTEARQEFYIAGHSMGRWCSKSNKARFFSELRRLLGERGEVTLVMLGARSPQLEPLKKATGRDYLSRIRESRRVLLELESSLDEGERTRLRIRMLEDHVLLPYMVVGNEQRLLTATYLARTDSESMPCVELPRGSETGRAIYDDFHKLAEEGGGEDEA